MLLVRSTIMLASGILAGSSWLTLVIAVMLVYRVLRLTGCWLIRSGLLRMAVRKSGLVFRGRCGGSI